MHARLVALLLLCLAAAGLALAACRPPEYAYIYNLGVQLVAVGADVTFDSNGISTLGIVHLPGTAAVVLADAADYRVTFTVSGTEPNQFALFINGSLYPGTVFGSGAGTQQNVGPVIVRAGAGDVLTLRNFSTSAPVGLATPIGGSAGTVNASLRIEKLS